MKRKYIFRAIAVLCVMASVLSVVRAVTVLNEYKRGEEEYSNLASILVSNTNNGIYVTKKGSGANAPDAAPVDVDFKLLNNMNANAVGWLYCAGTPINYPVVQSSDNSYYLNHLADNRKNSSGAIFMDAMNAPDLSDANTVIYGHNMKNGSMFACLGNYDNQSYYKKHPVMYYLTPDRNYRIDIFASYETTGDSEAFTMFFDSEQTYDKYLKNIWSKSLIDTSDLPMSVNDNIVTLSTCTYGFNNARFVVQGKVTPLD